MPRKVLETFAVEYLQILDENGQVDKALEPGIPPEDLRRLYQTMLAARMLDRRMTALQQQGRIGTFPGIQGQEASLGCTYALEPQDWLVPSFRETACLFWRGAPMKNPLLYYMGMEMGNRHPDEARILPTAITIGTQTIHAAGLAWAARLRGDDVVVLCYFGDGATSEGDFHEACNMAGVFQVPVVLVCINNQFAISVPRSQQTRAKTIAQKALAYGFPGIQVDGNDILATYAAAREAIARARSGKGPTLIECITYRMCPHTTADDPRRYRTEDEVQEWQRRDPMIRFRTYLEQKKLWSPAWQQQIETTINEEIETAVREAEAERAQADPLEMFDHVFAELTPELEAQKALFSRELLCARESALADARG
jgi:pyruvate dehydrogenase E1 component alpha subunit